MNKERLNEIALWLEAGAPERGNVTRFVMKWFLHPETEFITEIQAHETGCKTTCCIAGAAVAFFAPVLAAKANKFIREQKWISRDEEDYVSIAWAHASTLLGLSEDEAEALFAPGADYYDLIDSAWAARCIRHFMETGLVDWDATEHPASDTVQLN